ncbi:hypothetical protein [Streptomyces sp. NBC_00258]|uniref:hypothetical protein n=1 Tax=Streptomyces sp. NBC_00258 TaxID=2903642 RepID=UPI002E2DFE31|nr:hypothetical protein [Streptomyces sp. NBC_00258]
MARRKHTDLSNEEPGLRAEPILDMEKMDLTVSRKGLRLLTAMHRDSHLGAGAVSLLVLTAMLVCAAGIGALAFWVGLGPTGCMISAGVAAGVAFVVIVFLFAVKETGHRANADNAPATRPPVNRPGKKPKRPKKGKGRR